MLTTLKLAGLVNPIPPLPPSLTGLLTMHRFANTLVLAALTLTCSSVFAQQADPTPGFWTTPTIQNYGKMHYLPNGAYQPEKGTTYKIIFSLTKGAKTPADVNPALDHVARTVNLYVAAGVPVSHLKFVAVAYGEATPLALSDAAYQAKFGTANPNLPLIAALRHAGVDIAVCGQAVAEHHFEYSDVDNSVTTSLSGLTTITTLEHKGYTLMPM